MLVLYKTSADTIIEFGSLSIYITLIETEVNPFFVSSNKRNVFINLSAQPIDNFG